MLKGEKKVQRRGGGWGREGGRDRGEKSHVEGRRRAHEEKSCAQLSKKRRGERGTHLGGASAKERTLRVKNKKGCSKTGEESEEIRRASMEGAFFKEEVSPNRVRACREHRAKQ